MDIKKGTEIIVHWIKKYKYVALVLLIGVILMLLPTKNTATQDDVSINEASGSDFSTDISAQLQEILSEIDGVGDVRVLLSYAAGERTEYQADETVTTSESGSTVKKETVIITDADRAQQSLISQIFPPEYLGAIVICDGADNTAVKLAVVEAVSKITGLGSDKISVLKMK